MYKFRRFIVIGFALYLSTFALTSFAQENVKEDEALFVAKRAFEDGFYEVSLGLLERFLKTYPASPKLPEVNLLIGECYFHQSKFLDALSIFEELLNSASSKDIKDAVFYWIAEVHFKGNNFNKASSYYRKIIQEFPKSRYIPSAYYSMGWCLFQESKFAQALEYFKSVEEKYPKVQQAQDASFKIVECLYNLKDYSGLKERLKVYLKANSADTARLAYLYFYEAEADYYLNNFAEAINEYELVIKNSQDAKIQALSKLGQAWCYLKLKRYDDSGNLFSNIKADDLEKRSCDVLLLGKAMLMGETNRAKEAKEIYDELLKKSEDPLVLAEAYLGKADSLYNLGGYQAAVEVYKEALDKLKIPQDAPQSQGMTDKLHYGLAWAFLKQGEFKEAIKEFQKIAKTSNDNIVKVSALCQIGDAYQDSGDFNLAREAYDAILKDYPDSFYSDYVQYQLGLTLLKISNYEGAIMSLLALKRNFPESKLLDQTSYALGLAYFQRQDYNSSKAVFEKFDQEFKESNLKPQALYLLGTSLYNLADFPKAIEVFKNIIRLYGQDVELVQKAEYEIADCYDRMGDELEAMTRFKALRSKYPYSGLSAEIVWWLGEYYYRHNDLVLARRYFSSLVQDFPQSNLVADAYYALGTSYEEESKHDEAVENFKKIIEMGKLELGAQAAIAIADIYAKEQKTEAAINAYKDIVKEYPSFANLIYPKMAGLIYRLGNLSEALDLYRKSLELVPVKEMAAIQLKIAEVLQQEGSLDAAIEEYLKVTYLYSENNYLAVKALLRIASIYEGKENFNGATKVYQRIISMNTEEAKYAKERIGWIKTHIK